MAHAKPIMSNERWLPVTVCEDYDVSNCGRLRSWKTRGKSGKRRLNPVILAEVIACDGYAVYSLAISKGARQQFHVHRLVLEAFVGPCPPGMQCRHLDGNRHNNILTNLCWGTWHENEEDKWRHGTAAYRDRHPRAKLTTPKVAEIRERLARGEGPTLIARDYGVSDCAIHDIAKGRTWTDR